MTAAAQLRIARLAANPALHRAFRWLHLHQMQLRQWQLEMLRIPAPPFGEQARAAWFLERFRELGLVNVHLDGAGNALAELPCAAAGSVISSEPMLSDVARARLDGVANGAERSGRRPAAESPVVLLSAHLDTVFPPGTPTNPTEIETCILAPGACDNAAGLSALLGLAAALRHAEFVPAAPILFAANVGEEGEGDLRGMRHLFDPTASPYALRIAAAIALEGGGSAAVITSALASRRFRITVDGPGGHSWTDAGAPNPILVLARALLALESITQMPDQGLDKGADRARDRAADPTDGERPESYRTTLNVGQIAGGTSINSIPSSASALIDLRSTDSAQLEAAELTLRETLDRWVTHAPVHLSAASSQKRPALSIEIVGDRPGGVLPDDSPLLTTLRAVDRLLSLRTEPGLGSTDANIPLSLGVPAIAIGAGGLGGGIHTLQEWYDPTGRNSALRRILLTLLDTAQLAAEGAG